MSSWVRYSITVYIGLLISGALSQTPRQAPSVGPEAEPKARHVVPAVPEEGIGPKRVGVSV